MRNKIPWLKAILIFTIGFVFIGVTYCFFARPLYEVSGTVTIIRPSLPPIAADTPEPRNRWVWIRDGLSFKEILLQDNIFSDFIDESETLQKRYKKFALKYSMLKSDDLKVNFIHHVKKEINLMYTGGDSNTFIFTVRDSNPIFAKELVNMLISNLQKMFEDMLYARNEEYLQVLERKMKSLELQNNNAGSDGLSATLVSHQLASLEDAYGKLSVENILQNVQSKKLVKIISHPNIPLFAVWPRWDLVLLFSTTLGVFSGSLFHNLRSGEREE